MLQTKKIDHPNFGESLYATNGVAEIIIPLTYGIRIGHLSLCGGKNVFFEQPKDSTDLTHPGGWRIFGGHRLWISPEEDEVYYPDQQPISYAVEDDCIVLTQPEDPWIHMVKSMRISFGEGATLQIVHKVENTASEARTCALWAISAMAPGGKEYIPLKILDRGFKNSHWISFWNYTDIADPRAKYGKEEICLTYMDMPYPYKIGVSRLSGPVRYVNNGVVFEKDFAISEDGLYPDNDVAYETYMCRHMIEVESLSPLMTIPAGESREHTECWKLTEAV